MESETQKRQAPNLNKYEKDELKLAYDFSKKIYDEMGGFIKAIVLFGSVARVDTERPGEKIGDIDILVVVDDVTLVPGPDLVEAYRVIVEKIIGQVSPKLHITTLKLTSFWEYVRAGDPVAVNILRDGVALLDTGFFDPLQALLIRGKIRPSQESIYTYFSRAPRTLNNSRWHVLQACVDLYWAVIDSAHASLMKLGEVPPSPEHVADLLDERMVKPKLLDKKYADTMRTFYRLQKMIVHREIREVNGAEYERYFQEAHEFVSAMEEYLNRK